MNECHTFTLTIPEFKTLLIEIKCDELEASVSTRTVCMSNKRVYRWSLNKTFLSDVEAGDKLKLALSIVRSSLNDIGNDPNVIRDFSEKLSTIERKLSDLFQ